MRNDHAIIFGTCLSLKWPISCASTASSSSSLSCSRRVSNSAIFRPFPKPVKKAFECLERLLPSMTWMPALMNPVRLASSFNRSFSEPSGSDVNLLNKGRIKIGASTLINSWKMTTTPHAHNHQYSPLFSTSQRISASSGTPIARLNTMALAWSVHHVRWVELLKSNRSSSRNCECHENGRLSSDIIRIIVHRASASPQWVCPLISTMRPNSSANQPLNRRIQRSAVL